MAILKVSDVRSARIGPLINKTRLQLRLQVSGASPYESIELEIASDGALILANAIREFLDKNPTPPSRALRAAGRNRNCGS
jgi:hypothetical protein